MKVSISDVEEIEKLLIAYSKGDYHVKAKISSLRDKRDIILSGINMLGEELNETTISRDYFSSIYNAVAEMIIEVSSKGNITNINKAAESALNINKEEILNKPINEIIIPGNDLSPGKNKLHYSNGQSFFSKMKKELTSANSYSSATTNYISLNNKPIPVSCSCTKIYRSGELFKGYLVIAKDMTESINAEKLLLRTIVDTQEKEQKRIADDLHDSLGQELAGVKLYLNVLDELFLSVDKEHKKIFESCKSMLDSSVKNLRSICFEIMPSSLESEGIKFAIQELVNKLNRQKLIKINYSCTLHELPLSKSLEIAIYRIVQEFINNTIKHAKAKNIDINLSDASKLLTLSIADDGCGFDMADKANQKGKGLNNIRSRTKVFNGIYELTSKKDDGTKLLIKFPVNDITNE